LLLKKLKEELLAPGTVDFIAEQVQEAIAEQQGTAERQGELRKRLAQERTKRDNLVRVIEDGGENVGALLTALKAREDNVLRLVDELVALDAAAPQEQLPSDVHGWVQAQLQDLHALLKENPEKVQAEFRRLNLHLTFTPVGSDTDKAFFHVNGQCDLSALAFSRLWPASSPGSGAFLSLSLERSAHSRTPVLLRFRVELPSVEATGRWRERGRCKLKR
jgi:hypothetical protein